MSQFKKAPSLRTKLIGMSMSLNLLLGMSSFLVMMFLVNLQQKETKELFSTFAVFMSDALGAQFYERYSDVQAFALNPDLQSSDQKVIVTTLNKYTAMYGIYDLIMVVAADGRLVGVNDKDFKGNEIKVSELYKKNFKEEPWFRSVMKGEFTEDKVKGFAGTFFEDIQFDSYASEVYGEKRMTTGFSAPIRNSAGEVIGVVTNRGGSRWYEVAFLDVYKNFRTMGMPDAEIALLSKDGTLIADYDPDPHAKEVEEVKHDYNLVMKKNLVKEGVEAAVLAGKRESGVIESIHEDLKINQLVGFAPVSGAKFIDSIGWSVLVRESTEEIYAAVDQAQRWFYVGFAIVMLVSVGFSFWFSTHLSNRLRSLAASLSSEGEQVATNANLVSASSASLSEASTEQASAIQQTAASIDQVSAMVKKNSENAVTSKDASATSREAAQQGQEAVQRMLKSIGDISEGNEMIMNQVTEGNRKISEVVQLISEIGNKTKVINDIVFQTKLLSFNASVEAARAGEHGKGFAVVAEEVGNLAQMSGNAAKEISEMLDGSLQRVEGIVNETKASVERMVVDGKGRVETGKSTAQECSRALDSILESFQKVDIMVSEIASASREQSQGVGEINKAINQLDQVTQQNSQVSQKTANAAEELNSKSRNLSGLVTELIYLVEGQVTRGSEPSASSPPAVQRKVDFRKPSASSAKVVAMPTRKSEPSFRSTPGDSSEPAKPAAAKVEMASGDQMPAHDDPRFQDV